MLKINNIEVNYLNVILVLRAISMEVPKGSIVALLGANGAGKSTTLKAISGLLHIEEGKIIRGNITFDGQRIDKLSPQAIAMVGIIQVLEGRRTLEHMTVEENLRVGGSLIGNIKKNLEMIYELFPRLDALRHATSGYLSGGEGQMLVLGRALMALPKLILLDEPSLGLAPLVVQDIYESIKQINDEQKTSVLLVEQNANVALNISSYGYIMENGRIVLDGPAEKLKENEDIKEFYLGLSEVGKKKSYRDVKHYRRRKRWLG
jgi:branched-chain amino acid transport system ATP-binding protein